ncbi:rodlin [Streptomyces orinoci]|uniref:Rodlin n=1 Tax=Streptomyces orinoci TaxID=67339 RepID=A0ABV3JZH5_STRON|nr:rodlin [Streptomyces orinoci]
MEQWKGRDVLKKMCTAVALTASTAGVLAGPATAEPSGGHVTSGTGARTEYGRTEAGGKDSPQITAVQGSLNKLCVGLGKIGIQSVLVLINIGVQDIPVLSSEQQQQCTEQSALGNGDNPLSHLLDDIPVVADNGSAGG